MDAAPGHIGIASGAPSLFLGDILLVASVLAIWANEGRLNIGWIFVAFAVPAFICLFTIWGNTPEQQAGIKLYLTAVIAFGVGRWLGENATGRAGLVIAFACLIAIGLQFVLAIAQYRGITLLPVSKDAARWIAQGRMVGLYEHPAILGKSVCLMFCFLLPLSTSDNQLTRRIAYSAIVLGSIATLLTLSRANVFTVGVGIAIWILLSGRVSSNVSRIGVVLVTGILVLANTNLLTQLELRQARDPYGGQRAQIFATGLKQIAAAPLSGTGPNYYGEIVGRYNSLAAIGYPIHNSFLFPIAELGIPLGLILLLPLALTVIASLRRMYVLGRIDVRSAALLAMLPGISVIAWTGWGMMSTDSLPLWYAAFGFLASGMTISGADERGAGHNEAPTRTSAMGSAPRGGPVQNGIGRHATRQSRPARAADLG